MDSKQGKNFSYAEKASTSILYEEPSLSNPYLPEKQYLYGYDIETLVEKKDFIDVLFLMFKGELPSLTQKNKLQTLMIGLCNLGPRFPGIRASMTAGVSKTRTSNLLPLGLNVQSGKINGAEEVEAAYKFIIKNRTRDLKDVIDEIGGIDSDASLGDVRIAPGFGSLFGGIDLISEKLANRFLEMDDCGESITWSSQLIKKANFENIGWLSTGVVAAVLSDLEFGARESAGMFQLIIAPAILCHGLEQSHKTITSMPFLKDEDYYYE